MRELILLSPQKEFLQKSRKMIQFVINRYRPKINLKNERKILYSEISIILKKIISIYPMI